MPLAPEARAFLDQLAALGAPPLEALPLDQGRQVFAQLLGSADREPVHRVVDGSIPVDGGEIPVRLYVPGGGRYPVFVYYHGGGWTFGDLDAYDHSCRALANAAGCLVASVAYRLSPEHRFPVAPHDCYAALQWAAANAASFGGDPARLAVGGDSAGGNLAAVVAQMARDRAAPALRYQVLVYPVTDHGFETASYRENGEAYLLTTALMRWFWSQYLGGHGDGASPLASPLRCGDLTGLAPALVITAEFDPLRDEGEAYAARLRTAGVAVTQTRYDGMIHGFFTLTGVFDRGRHAVSQAASCLRAALG